MQNSVVVIRLQTLEWNDNTYPSNVTYEWRIVSETHHSLWIKIEKHVYIAFNKHATAYAGTYVTQYMNNEKW